MIGGVDEAGRGPVFGPLVVAGVAFDNDINIEEVGFKDSKQLSPYKREKLAEVIRKKASKYEILVIPASDIDDMRKAMTINEIEVNAFSKIIEKIKPDLCYVDSADVNDERFGKDILSRLSFKPKIISKHKADEIYPIVGAASILAKTTRDEQINKIAQELEKKINLPLGSGYPADPLTKKFLKSWVEKYGELPPYVRHSWATAKKIINESKIKKLDDF